MMQKRTILEKLGDLAFILTCVVLAGAAVYRAMPAKGAGRAAENTIRIGSPAVLPAVNFSRSERTVLAVISTSCSFCDASMPFYRELATDQTREEHQWSLVFVGLEDPASVTTYLQTHAIERPAVVPLTASLQIRGTPTLLVLNRSGVIIGAWSGVLDDRQQREVRKLIAG